MSRLKNQDLTKIYDDCDFTLGEVVEVDQRKYRFVEYNSGAGAVDAVAGQVGYLVGTGTTGMAPWEVTMDYDSAAAGTAITCPNAVAGFFQAALTDGKYGFTQISGLNKIAALTDGNVAVGNRLSIGTTDGQIIPLADGTPPLEEIGVALAADASTALAVGNLLIKVGE